MEIITFYSYKGGVGRTLALANVALYLSRFMQNVCVMDFDLESPGLHYKFQEFFKTTNIKCGLLDYIHSFSHEGHEPKSIKNYSLEIISPSKSRGSITIIPAGNVSMPDYWRKLAAIDWHSLFYEEQSQGVPFFIEMKERVKDEIKPDFLLIDSRTGITEMSGLCTSLLPDRVVFLIVNNQENIEGARQILRAIQRVERLPGQQPIKITFALTRIPSSMKEGERSVEDAIVSEILKFLNEPTEDLEEQLNIKKINIIHSDRDLELHESLRIGQKGISKETTLLRDYLGMISEIVPEEIILKRIDPIINEIITAKKLFENPEKAQLELEEIAATFPHKKTLQRLIDLYLLRNTEKEKTLQAFHKLWQNYGIDDEVTLSKYAFLFTKLRKTYGEPKFEKQIVEKYISLNPKDSVIVERELAEQYFYDDEYAKALEHFNRIVNHVSSKDRDEVIERMLNACIMGEMFDQGENILKTYADIINKSDVMKVAKLNLLFKTGQFKDLEELLSASGIIERDLRNKNFDLYVQAMIKYGQGEKAEDILESRLVSYLRNREYDGVYAFARKYQDYFGSRRFSELLKKHPDLKEALYEFRQRRYGRRYPIEF